MNINEILNYIQLAVTATTTVILIYMVREQDNQYKKMYKEEQEYYKKWVKIYEKRNKR